MVVGGAILLALAAGTHCRFLPPVLSAVEPGEKDDDSDRDPRHARAEPIEVEVADGEKLRGLFVPSDRDAPVVLHLLESGGSASVDEGRPAGENPGDIVHELADLGFASLLLDYRGVGTSDGTRRTAHLTADVHAMWSEAVRRAKNDARLVYVRGTSLGTIGAMILLRDGIAPAGLVLIAPVDAATVADHFAAAVYGSAARGFADWMLAPVAEQVDPATRLAQTDAPLFIAAASNDELWPPAEQVGVHAVVEAKHGVFADEHAFTHRVLVFGDPPRSPLLHHISFTIHSKRLSDAEASFWKGRGGTIDLPSRMQRILDGVSPALRHHFATEPAARERLEHVATGHVADDPRLLAFLVVCRAEGPEAQVFLDDGRHWPSARLDALDDPRWLDALTFTDPAGDLSGDRTLHAFGFFHRGAPADATPDPATLTAVLDSARGVGAEGIGSASRSWYAHGPGKNSSSWGEDFRSQIWAPLVAESRLEEDDAARQFVRILLHGAGIPDRVAVAADGAITLAARDGDHWVAVDPALVFERVATDPPAPPR